MTLTQPAWQAIENPPALTPGEVHVWAINAQSAEGLPLDCLTAQERGESERFVQPRDRQRALVSRAFRRATLARYLGAAPESLKFEAGEHGKPMLAGEFAGLSFNVSHSRDLVVLAVMVFAEIGVDVELIRHNIRMDEIASRFLPPETAALIVAADGEAKTDLFFRTWTEVEATLKARGLGLAKGLGSLENVVCAVRHFQPAPGYAGAVAACESISGLHFFKWANPA